MKLENLNISNHTNGDPCGRVFFYEERVLRAINPEAEQLVREFLASELYRILVENGWFVKTWIVDDVQLEGYPLIVESERVYACQWQLLTFEQLRDISIFIFKIHEICNRHGWAFWDDGLNNFGLKNGQLTYLDLGGIYKGCINISSLERNWKILRLMSLGMISLAKSTRVRTEVSYNDYLLPAIQPKLDDYLEFLIHPLGKKYTVYRKQSRPPIFSFRTRFTHALINKANRFVERITKKPYPWRLFYVKPDKLNERDFERITPYYDKYTDIEYVSNDVIEYFIEHSEKPHSIMLYGEYSIEDIERLRDSYHGRIWICSPLQPYTDKIYNEINIRKLDIGILSYNLCSNAICDNEKIIELGINGLLCHKFSISSISQLHESAYGIGKFARYFDQIYLEEDGICSKYIKDNKIFKKVED